VTPFEKRDMPVIMLMAIVVVLIILLGMYFD